MKATGVNQSKAEHSDVQKLEARAYKERAGEVCPPQHALEEDASAGFAGLKNKGTASKEVGFDGLKTTDISWQQLERCQTQQQRSTEMTVHCSRSGTTG